MTTLQILWFGIIAVFLVGYTVLAGIDLGIGVLLLLTRNDRERRMLFGGIGPFWDGNQVWLIAVGALLFTVFPPVYAAVFSGFYHLIIYALLALIVRAVSIEFGIRSTNDDVRRYWSVAVGVSTIIAVFLFGVILGNIVRGVPLDRRGEYVGSRWNLMNTFALLTGGVNLAMLTTYGATYLCWRTDGLLKKRARQWVRGGWTLYVLLLFLLIGYAILANPHLLRNFMALPVLWGLPGFGVITVLAIGLWNVLRREKLSFFTAAFSIVLLLLLVVTALFPLLIPARGDLTRSVTIANAASSPTSQLTMLVVTAISMPLVILSTIWSYRLFGGKISPERHY